MLDLWRVQIIPGWRQGTYSTGTCARRLGFHLYNWFYNVGLSIAERVSFRSESNLLQIEYQRQSQLIYPSAFHLSWHAVSSLPSAQATRLAYGETAWFTLRKVMEVIQPTPDDVFCDLGCGAGRNLFYMNICHGIPVVGIELLADLAEAVKQASQNSCLTAITIKQEDFLLASLTGVTLVYITANGLDDEGIRQLGSHLPAQPTVRWIISTGKALALSDFELTQTYRLWFSWGRDWVYLYRRTGGDVPAKKRELKKRS